MSENMEMRKVLCNELQKLMEIDEKVVVIDGDLGTAMGTSSLKEKFPNRAFNAGIAEQNMAAMAAGMSTYGFIPFICTFTAFASRRICDQICVSIAYAKRNVKIIAGDPGIAAQLNGGTHMSLDDIGILRSIPDMIIFEAVDSVQLSKALPQISNHYGPVYLRLFRKASPKIFDDNYSFDLFKADILKEGKDVSIFASGIMVYEALKAYEKLKSQGIEAEIINIHTIKPIDKETIISSVKKTGCAVSCENHNVIGGLKSAIAEVLIEEYPVPLRSIGTKDHHGEVGTLDFLKEKFHMKDSDIVSEVYSLLSKK